MHAISSYRGNRPTHTQTQDTDRTDYNTLRRSHFMSFRRQLKTELHVRAYYSH